MNLYSIDGHSIPAPDAARAAKEFEKKYGKKPVHGVRLVSGKEPAPSPLFGGERSSFDDLFGGLFRRG